MVGRYRLRPSPDDGCPVLSRVPSDLPAETEDVMNRIIGACIEVHRHLGPGFLESLYHRAVCIELEERRIAFEKAKHVVVNYKGRRLTDQFVDLVVESCVVVEIKAVSQLEEIHGSQVVSYLRATGLRAGLLVNFNQVVLRAGLRRIIR
jgi:GxxExxY protein